MKEFLWGSEYLPFYYIIIRSAFLYISLVIATRIMGHRQVGLLSRHNYLVAAGIVSLATVRMVNPTSSFVDGILIIFAYAFINYLWSWIDLKKPALVDQSPLKIIGNGQILTHNLKKAKVPIEHLLAQLRLQKVGTINSIAKAMLEPMGKISIIKRSKDSPITKGQLQVWPNTEYIPTIIIFEGKILANNLKSANLNSEWINGELQLQNVSNIGHVYLALLDSSGKLFIQLKGANRDV